MTEGTRLEAFLAGHHGRPAAVVAHAVVDGAAREIELETLLRQAAVIARLLPDPSPGSEIAFAFGEDRAACAAALLATWARGHVAALPEDSARENVVEVLGRPRNVAFLQDTGVGRGICVPELLARTALEAPLDLHEPCGDRGAVLAFRRRDAGAELCEHWTTEALLEQVDELARRMELAPGARVASSLSPTVLPGLLAGLLVPLRHGGVFDAKVTSVPDALQGALRAERVHTFVATPAHARALAAAPAGALEPLVALFVADVPLDARHAALLRERHRLRVAPLGALPLAPAPRSGVCEALLAVDGVRDAASAVLSREEGGAEQLLVAVVAPAELEGELQRLVRTHVPAATRASLRLFPRLPRDGNGRLSAQRLFLAFGFGRDGRPPTHDLDWTRLPSAAGERARFRTRIPQRYTYFEGHFTGYPVLAGAVQVHELVLPCIRALRPELCAVRSLKALKFLARIAPGDELEVLLELTPGSPAVAFELRRGDTCCTLGRIEFAAESVASAP